MTDRMRARKRSKGDRPWWRGSTARLGASWLLFSLVITVSIGGVVYLTRESNGPEKAATAGEQVKPFELPDAVTGRNVSLAGYLGKQEIVIVSYMGWFCPGCEELLIELQSRQGDFENRGAALLVLGSQPEPMNVAQQNAQAYGISYPLLHDAGTSVTKELGLWSDQMQMPWMGYLVIDKAGRVVASELQLAEAKGAAPRNVDAILAALDEAAAAR